MPRRRASSNEARDGVRGMEGAVARVAIGQSLPRNAGADKVMDNHVDDPDVGCLHWP